MGTVERERPRVRAGSGSLKTIAAFDPWRSPRPSSRPASCRASPSSATARRRCCGRRGRRRAPRSAPARPCVESTPDLEEAAVFERVETREPARRRPRLVPHLDPDLVPVDEDAFRSRRDDDRRRSPAGRRPRAGLGVEPGRDPAQIVGEAAARRVEVEIAQLGVAPVPEAVDDERRRERERSGREDALLPLRPTRNVSSPART